MTMDCERFNDRLEAFLGDELPAEERRAVERHLRECASCRELADLASCSAEPPAALIDTVLASTSGSVCASAREQLCDLVDDHLPAADHELVLCHLESCRECAALSHALVRLSTDLPLLAELQPDAGFVRDVLARTSGRRTWAARLTDAWERLLARPRLALEGAYLGTVLFALIFGLSSAPLAGAGRAFDSVRITSTVEAKQARARVRTMWQRAEQKVDVTSRALVRVSAATIESIRTSVGTLWANGASEQETDATPSPQADEGNRGDE